MTWQEPDSASGPISAPASLAHLVERFLALNRALHAIAGNPYLASLARVATVGDLHEAILEIGYAANSKVLRDTGDERVHTVLNGMTELTRELCDRFHIRLSPQSAQQKHAWETAIARSPGGKWAFRDDGSLEIDVNDSFLRGRILHARRLWNHVCNYSGSPTDFEIELEAGQAEAFRGKVGELHSLGERLSQSASARGGAPAGAQSR